jgi:hypothetical protein
VVIKIISNVHLDQVLGKGAPKLSIISSAAFVFASLFYVYTIGSYFKLPIYFLHNRLVSKLYFTDIYIISKYVDHILIVSGIVLWLVLSLKDHKARFVAAVMYGGITIVGIGVKLIILVDFAALISIPLVICFLIYDRFASKKILNTNQNLYVNYFSIIGIAIGIVGINSSSAFPLFSVSSSSSSPSSISIPNYAYGIFVLFSSFSPILMILLINAVPVKILTEEIVRGILKIKKDTIFASLLSIPYEKIKLRNKVIYLSLIVLLSVILVFIPHLPTVNKNSTLVGADTKQYVNWENMLIDSHTVQEFIQQAFVTLQGGDRPIVLMFLFIFIKLTAGEPSYVIDYIPLILGPALVLVIYFLTREFISNDIIPLVASFLTAVSFHTLVGLYAGYYSNWLALIVGYLSLVFLFRFLKNSKRANLIIYFFLTIVMLFTHTYTWTILTMVIGIFLLVMLGFSYYPRRSIVFLLVALSCSVIIDVAKVSVTRSAGGIELDIATARSQEVGVGQLPVRWNNLIDTTEIYYGAAFSNVIILLLGLYWLFRSDMHAPSCIFLLVFLSIGIFPLFFGNWLIQSRVFYNIPFQIPAAFALYYIKREKYGSVVMLSVSIWLVCMAVRSVSNFSI